MLVVDNFASLVANLFRRLVKISLLIHVRITFCLSCNNRTDILVCIMVSRVSLHKQGAAGCHWSTHSTMRCMHPVSPWEHELAADFWPGCADY